MAEATSTSFLFPVQSKVQLLTTVASGQIRLGGSWTKEDQKFYTGRKVS